MSENSKKFTRRDFIKFLFLVPGAFALASCGFKFEGSPIRFKKPGSTSQALSLMGISPDILDDPGLKIPGAFKPEWSFTTNSEKGVTTWYALSGRLPNDTKYFIPGFEDFVVAYDPAGDQFIKVSVNGLESDKLLEQGYTAANKFFHTAEEYATRKGYTMAPEIKPPEMSILKTKDGQLLKYMRLSSYGDTVGAMLSRDPGATKEATRLYQEAYEMAVENWIKGGAIHWDPNKNNLAILEVIDSSGKKVNMAFPFDFEVANDLVLPVDKENLKHIEKVWKLNAKGNEIDLPATLPKELMAQIPESKANVSLIRVLIKGRALNIAIENVPGVALTLDDTMQMKIYANLRIANMNKAEFKQFLRSGITGELKTFDGKAIPYKIYPLNEKKGLSQFLNGKNFMSGLKALGPILLFLPGTVNVPSYYEGLPTTFDDRTLLLAITTSGEVSESLTLSGLYQTIMRYKEHVKSYFSAQGFLDLGPLGEIERSEDYLEAVFDRTVKELKQMERLAENMEEVKNIREYIDKSIDDTAVPVPIQVQFGSDALIIGGVKAEFPIRIAAFEIDGLKNLVFWYPEEKNVVDPATGQTIKTTTFKPTIRMTQSKEDPNKWNSKILDNFANTMFTGTGDSKWRVDSMTNFTNCLFSLYYFKDRVQAMQISCKLESSVK